MQSQESKATNHMFTAVQCQSQIHIDNIHTATYMVHLLLQEGQLGFDEAGPLRKRRGAQLLRQGAGAIEQAMRITCGGHR